MSRLFTNKCDTKYESKGKMKKWGPLDVSKLFSRYVTTFQLYNLFQLLYCCLHCYTSIISFVDCLININHCTFLYTQPYYSRIYEMNARSENDIDWNHIAENWHRYFVVYFQFFCMSVTVVQSCRPCSPEFLALKWNKIKAKVPKDNQRTFTGKLCNRNLLCT